MNHLYRILNIHFASSEPEILLALARYEHRHHPEPDPQVIKETKEYLLNPVLRQLYDRQLLQSHPDTETENYTPVALDEFFKAQEKVALLQNMNNTLTELKDINNMLETRIDSLRSEEKIYRFPLRDRELLDVNFQLFARGISDECTKTVFLSAMQILAQHKKPVRYLLCTESRGYSYVRYYEYVILKFRLGARKKYFLSCAGVDELAAKGIRNTEPARAGDGALFRSRILIDSENPAFLEDAAIDRIIEETLALFNHAIESIRTFNEAVVRIKKQRVENFLAKRIMTRAHDNIMAEEFLTEDSSLPLSDESLFEYIPEESADNNG